MSEIDAITKSRSDRALTDLAMVVALSILVFIFAASVELNERVLQWTRPLEAWQIDEIPEVLLTFAVGMGWFALRRRREAAAEIDLRIRAQREIAEILKRNRELSQMLLMLQDKERLAIARDLHDELGQSLTAIKVEAITIRDQCGSIQSEVHRSADLIAKTCEHVYGVVRSLLLRLRPATLDSLGLVITLRELVDSWQQRHNVATTFNIDGDADELGEIININLYRIVQEGLTNIAKHANAKAVRIELRRYSTALIPTKAQSWIQLLIEDDGAGMPSEPAVMGLGVLGIQERVRAIGGQISIQSSVRRGTRIAITIPVEVGDGE